MGPSPATEESKGATTTKGSATIKGSGKRSTASAATDGENHEEDWGHRRPTECEADRQVLVKENQKV